jgi:hypothetical protein
MSGKGDFTLHHLAPGAYCAGGGEVESLGDHSPKMAPSSAKVQVRRTTVKNRTAPTGGVTIDPARVPKLVNRLLAAAHKEDTLVDELCGAVLRTDWNAASNAVAALVRHRGGAAVKSSAGVDTAGG